MFGFLKKKKEEEVKEELSAEQKAQELKDHLAIAEAMHNVILDEISHRRYLGIVVEQDLLAAQMRGARLLAEIRVRLGRLDYYQVRVFSYNGDKKIGAIKTIRQVADLPLKESKEATEQKETVILHGISFTEAEKARRELEGAGIRVSVENALGVGV